MPLIFSKPSPADGLQARFIPLIMVYCIYALGSNGTGQLALGHTNDVSIPTKSLISSSSTSRISAIAAGGNHTLLHLESGVIYATGFNDNGRCGLPGTGRDPFTEFQIVDVEGQKPGTYQRFVACSATWEASTFVTIDRRVLVCGSGSKGELGLGEGVTNAPIATLIAGFPPRGTDIIDLAACVSHTVAVLSNGDVYGWGSGRKGQLGEASAVVWHPRRIGGIPFKALRAVCGREFTYIVGSPGTGEHVILGSDKWHLKSAAPSSVVAWKDIAASWGSIFVLKQDRTLVGWGRNDHGQLPPNNLPALRSIAAGSEHIIAQTSEGEAIAWGWGEHGNCGSPVLENGDVAGNYNILHHGRYVSNLGAGCATSWIVAEFDDCSE